MPLRGTKIEQVLGSSAQKDCPHHCPSATERYGLPHIFPTDRCVCERERGELQQGGCSLQPAAAATLHSFSQRLWRKGTEWAGKCTNSQPFSYTACSPLLQTSAIFLPPRLLEDSYSAFGSLSKQPLACEMSPAAW